MEWLKNWLDPEGAERRGQIRALCTEVDQAIDRLYIGPTAWERGRVYSLRLPEPRKLSSMREVYWGFPPVDEMNIWLEMPKDELGAALFWDEQPYVSMRSYSAVLKYIRQNHRSKIDSPRSIDFGDEILRLKIIKETLELVQLNQPRAEVVIVKPVSDVIKT